MNVFTTNPVGLQAAPLLFAGDSASSLAVRAPRSDGTDRAHLGGAACLNIASSKWINYLFYHSCLFKQLRLPLLKHELVTGCVSKDTSVGRWYRPGKSPLCQYLYSSHPRHKALHCVTTLRWRLRTSMGALEHAISSTNRRAHMQLVAGLCSLTSVLLRQQGRWRPFQHMHQRQQLAPCHQRQRPLSPQPQPPAESGALR